MADIILPAFIYAYVALIMIAIGIMQYKSKKPTGFYTGETPPKEEQLTDVTAWNHRHGMMWIIYGIVIIVSFLFGLLIPHEVLSALLPVVIILGALPVMILYHHKLKKQYFKA